MKTLNIPLDQSDYDKLRIIKGGLTWKEFLLLWVKNENDETTNINKDLCV